MARPLGRVQRPVTGNTVQPVHATLLEADARASYEVLDRAGDEDLSGVCGGGDAGAGVDADAGELPVRDLELGGVEPGPYVDTELGQLCDHDQSGADSASRSVEGGEEPSPAVSISCPEYRANARRTTLWCRSSTSRQRASPSRAVSWVDPTMSVTRMVASTRSGSDTVLSVAMKSAVARMVAS